MASRRVGHILDKRDLTPTLTIFRVAPETGAPFPPYDAGQYIALGRDDVPLTTRIGTDRSGRPLFGPDVDHTGRQRIGTVMHSYSIASAPWETETHGFLEFYVVQETAGGRPGRLSTVLLGLPCGRHEPVNYVDRIVGHFTLQRLVRDARQVIMVGTGTGLAPFVSMLKQLHHTGDDGRSYTLLHTNRTYAELGYHQTLLDIEASAAIDFVYVATVSRPTARDRARPDVGVGRATNVLRWLWRLPLTEEEDLAATEPGTPDRKAAEAALDRTLRPAVPPTHDLDALRARLAPERAVVLACGNPRSTRDIQHSAGRLGVRSAAEAW